MCMDRLSSPCVRSYSAFANVSTERRWRGRAREGVRGRTGAHSIAKVPDGGRPGADALGHRGRRQHQGRTPRAKWPGSLSAHPGDLELPAQAANGLRPGLRAYIVVDCGGVAQGDARNLDF